MLSMHLLTTEFKSDVSMAIELKNEVFVLIKSLKHSYKKKLNIDKVLYAETIEK